MEVVQKFSLIESGSESVHETITNIVLSAVHGNGFKMVLCSPIAESKLDKINRKFREHFDRKKIPECSRGPKRSGK